MTTRKWQEQMRKRTSSMPPELPPSSRNLLSFEQMGKILGVSPSRLETVWSEQGWLQRDVSIAVGRDQRTGELHFEVVDMAE